MFKLASSQGSLIYCQHYFKKLSEFEVREVSCCPNPSAGVGNLPGAVLHKLQNHKDLGIHTEMFSDSVVDLVECGAITNAKKAIQTGKIVSSFAIGSKRLYDFIDDNSFVGKYIFMYNHQALGPLHSNVPDALQYH